MPDGQAHTSVVLAGAAWWWLVPLAALAGWLIWRLYIRESRPLGPGGLILRLLRTAAVVLLVGVLAEPVLSTVWSSTVTPVVLVLKDRSGSSAVVDKDEPPAIRVRQCVAWGLLEAGLRDRRAEAAIVPLAQAQADLGVAQEQARRILQADAAVLTAEQVSTVLTAVQRALQSAANQLDQVAAGLGAKPANAREKGQAETGALAAGLAQEVRRIADNPLLRAGVARPATPGVPPANKQLEARLAEAIQSAADLATRLQGVQDRTDEDLAASGLPAVKAALERLDTLSRAARIDQALETQLDPATRARLALVEYDFDTTLHPRATASGPATRAASAPATAPAGGFALTDTDLATPLLRLAELHNRDQVAAVVILSDGRQTAGPSPVDAARVLAAQGMAVHTVGIGPAEPPRDAAITRLEGPLSVFKDERFKLVAQLQAHRLAGQKAELRLLRGNDVVEKRTVRFNTDGVVSETFELTCPEVGTQVYAAEIAPLEGETLAANNRAETLVEVSGDRLKALLVDEQPRWESRYLAALLRRERKIDLAERFLSSLDLQGLPAEVLPADDRQLDTYDLLVLGDLTPDRLTPEVQQRIADFVAKRGGFLIVLAGRKAMPRRYLDGPLADALPVAANPQRGETAVATSGAPAARVTLDEENADHDIVAVLRSPTLNRQLWPALPALEWLHRPAFPKPGALALLRSATPDQAVVLAIQPFGSGRVLYCGSDETWRWRYKVADRVHASVWSAALRWGTAARLSGDERLKIALGASQISPQGTVEILARPRTADGQVLPPETRVVAEVVDLVPPRRVDLQAVPDSGGLFRGQLSGLPAGAYQVRVFVDEPEFAGLAQARNLVVREAGGQEGLDLARDAALLGRIATAGNGQAVDLTTVGELFRGLTVKEQTRRHERNWPIWDNYAVLVVIVGLLSAEWILRKRYGLM